MSENEFMPDINTYKYHLWAWAYVDGDYREWNRTIHRKKELTEEQKQKLSGNFADKLAEKYNCSIQLYGCNEM